MDKSQAQREVEEILREIVPELRVLNSSAIHGQSVGELRWRGMVRYLPIADSGGDFASVQIR
jgi:hypothetical protein